MITQSQANQLLHDLVAIPSLSTQEAAASAWLVEQMQLLGYERAFVDAAGNAVGERGQQDAAHVVVLLGHIDTVPGAIPVRIESTPHGDLLYGRGSVDAKGPLAAFVCAASRIDSDWLANANFRIVVVGAVEEEAASSRGARYIRDRFNGVDQPFPLACVIGEPSAWTRVTLGYKGRLLAEIDASQPMAHTAGPGEGVAVLAVAFWQWLSAYADRFNQGREKAFDQLQPSLRKLFTYSDEQMQDHVQAQAGIRLPLDFDADHFLGALVDWSAQHTQIHSAPLFLPALTPETLTTISFIGDPVNFVYSFRSFEPAWRGDRNNGLVRSFLAAIRTHAPDVRPSLLSKTGTSDMNVVGPAWPCPVLAYGPGDSALDHTPQEHINLDEYWRSIQVLESAIGNFISEYASSG
jgi:LysW-gamma-L-lysine carboxypeptidase